MLLASRLIVVCAVVGAASRPVDSVVARERTGLTSSSPADRRPRLCGCGDWALGAPRQRFPGCGDGLLRDAGGGERVAGRQDLVAVAMGGSGWAAAGGLAGLAIASEVLQVFNTFVFMYVLNRYTGAPSFAELVEIIAGFFGGLGWVSLPLYAALLHFITILPLMSAILFIILAGTVFGPVRGTVIVSLSLSSAAAISATLARSVARARKFSLADIDTRAAAVDTALASKPPRTTLLLVTLLRLSPVLPFTFSNYLAGVTSIPIPVLFLGTLIGTLPTQARAHPADHAPYPRRVHGTSTGASRHPRTPSAARHPDAAHPRTRAPAHPRTRAPAHPRTRASQSSRSLSHLGPRRNARRRCTSQPARSDGRHCKGASSFPAVSWRSACSALPPPSPSSATWRSRRSRRWIWRATPPARADRQSAACHEKTRRVRYLGTSAGPGRHTLPATTCFGAFLS